MRILTDDFDWCEQGIRVIRPLLLLRVPPLHHGTFVWLLLPKLIAREAKNLETLLPILTVQLSELSEVKSGQASGAGKIGDENCFLFLEELTEFGMDFTIHILNRLTENLERFKVLFDLYLSLRA